MIEGIILLVIAIVFVVYMVVKSKNKNADLAVTSGNSSAKEAAYVSAATQAQTMPVIQSGIEEETVAAIMAAISCLADPATGAQYTIRSINRVKSERPAWCFAGMQQNTRPF